MNKVKRGSGRPDEVSGQNKLRQQAELSHPHRLARAALAAALLPFPGFALYLLG